MAFYLSRAKLTPMASPTKTSSTPPTRLRVLSYNIHQGLTIHRRQIALSILKEAIRSLEADIVLLQEVAGTTHTEMVPGEDEPGVTEFQLEGLADELWPYYAYQKNSIFSGGFHGNAILSRYPIVKWNNIDITVSPLDKRGLLHGEVSLPDRGISVHVMAIHLGLLQFERRRQLKQVCEYIQENLPPESICLLGGDFNDWRQIVSRRLSKRVGMQEAFRSQDSRHARTFPSRFPVLRLDRIYFRGVELKTARCLRGRPWQFLSDHLPLMADFVLK